MPVRLECPLLWTKTPYANISRQLGCPLWTKNTKENNTNKEEYNNDNGAEQPLTVEVRLERRPEKNCYKKPVGQNKQEIWVGTMAHSSAIVAFPTEALQR